jgi:hypothetical protein
MRTLTIAFATFVFFTQSIFATQSARIENPKSQIIIIGNQRVTLPAGTQVTLEVMQHLEGKNLYPSQSIPLRVKFDVEVDGKILIKAGALGTGIISRLEKGKSFGKSGKVEIMPLSVQAADGQQVVVSGMPLSIDGKSGGNKAVAASVGAAIVTGGVGLVAGAFVKGKTGDINAGTLLIANTTSNAKIDVEY